MSTTDDRCGWDTGTVWTGPARCPKPPKFTTNCPGTNTGKVCGIHARSIRSGSYGGVMTTYTLEPITT